MDTPQYTQTDKDDILEGRHTSVWIGTTPETHFPRLDRDLRVDAVIVGGGIVGVTTAVMLKEAGLDVAIIDARRILTGVTGHTTAKITSLHGLIYNYLISRFGRDEAFLYADANETAIRQYAALIEQRGISCDFSRTSAHTYTQSEKHLSQIEEEVRAAESLNLPVSYTETTSLPFPVQGAVCFSNQAHFHPRKYLLALVDGFVKEGGLVFEETRALSLNGGKVSEVITDKGVIRGRNVIIATHFPFYDPAFFFARMHPTRSYVLGVRLNGPAPDGMYISTEKPFHSVRSQPVEDGEMVLLGGYDHDTGHSSNTIKRYRKLERFARENFDVKSIDYYWSTQDNTTIDRVPYIGKIPPSAGKIYVATGFDGWGMTHSMVAAMILADGVLGRHNPWSSLYNPFRTKATSLTTLARQNLHVAKTFVEDHLFSPNSFEVDDLDKREGGVIRVNYKNTGVAKDHKGDLHVVSPTCTHMGCVVTWNNAEESWDCPCHGSRFDAEGHVIHGPALKDLDKGSLDGNEEA